jgi:hypothetical protein
MKSDEELEYAFFELARWFLHPIGLLSILVILGLYVFDAYNIHYIMVSWKP